MTDRTELRPVERDELRHLAALANSFGLLARLDPREVALLLDQLDAAETALARVRELHASSGTAESQGYDAKGRYGFIAPYCTGCEASDEYAVAWPCPTIAAIGGGES